MTQIFYPSGHIKLQVGPENTVWLGGQMPSETWKLWKRRVDIDREVVVIVTLLKRQRSIILRFSVLSSMAQWEETEQCQP